MAEIYFQVVNDNNKIVIDDQYENRSFVHMSEIITVKESDEGHILSDGSKYPWYQVDDGMNGRYLTESQTYMISDLNLKQGYYPSYIGIRSVDNPEGDFAVVELVRLNDYSFKYRIRSMRAGAKFQIAAWASLSSRIPSKSGMQLFNANRELVFDAELGYLQVLDANYVIRDLYSSEVSSYPVSNSNLPGVDFSKIFLISMQRPRATTGGTIIINHRQYVPRLRRDPNTLLAYVDLEMWGAIGGSRLQQYQRVFSYQVAYIPF